MKRILTLAIAIMASTSFICSAENGFVINNCPVTPVRQEPSEVSEQVTQLLFGEVCELVERRSSWAKIRSTIDGQEGWVSYKMMIPVDQKEAINLLGERQKAKVDGTVAVPMAVATDMQTGEKRMLTIGTRLSNYTNGTFEVFGKRYQIDPACVYSLEFIGERLEDPSLQDGCKDAYKVLVNGKEVKGEDVVHVAKQLLNVSYLWGGKNMMGYDCSGFTQTVYSVFGINLLRNAREQVTQGQEVKSLAESQPGDLVFFDHADRDPKATRITHVGMLISPTEVIHCSGCVHVDRIDENGIHLANGEMTHHLAKIKRYL